MSEQEIEKWTMESKNKVSEIPLSMSCSSFEVLDPHDPVISRLATQLFKKTNDYLQEEVVSGQEHYALLEDINNLTNTKYSDLKNLTTNLNKSLIEYNELYILKIKPLLQQIDVIDVLVAKFEENAYRLDNYTRNLKARFKSVLGEK